MKWYSCDHSATTWIGALGWRLSNHIGFWKQRILKFFFGQQTNNIHEFEGCFLKAQVSSNGFQVFNSYIVEPWIFLDRLQKYLRIFYFQKTLWLDTLLPSAPVRVDTL